MPAGNTILIIDDEPNLRRSLSIILERSGYKVTCAGSAQEGLQMLQSGPFDLTFLDIKMPGRSGMAILPEIRQKYRDMPVLILTAHASLDTAIEAVQQGARDYLLKPIEPQMIIQRTTEILTEINATKKRREITSQIEGLLSELQQVERIEPSTINDTEPLPVSAGRFLRNGVFTLDLHARRALIHLKDITLAPSNFDYLVALLRHSPDPVPFQTLVKEAQGYDLSRAEAREISRWQIHELRKALEEDPHTPRYIVTVRDVGYRLIA